MLQIEEAQAILQNQVHRITDTIELPLFQALGYVLAEDVAAKHDQPPFPRSPLDGYAVRSADICDSSKEIPTKLQVIANIYAGETFDGIVGQMECVRLTTGAPIPEGADTVIRQEDTDCGLESVAIYASSKAFQNYCFQGEDYKEGTVLLKAGQVINAGCMCVLSSIGQATVKVYRKPNIAVISTGDEVIEPGDSWRPGKIYDSNRFYISARLAEGQNPAFTSIHAGDDAQVVADAIRKAAKDADFIITTGGVSVGEKDILHEVVTILNAKQLFWRINIKPGAPTLAFDYDGTLVLSLSGNPYGAIANYELLARPVLQKLTGNPIWEIRTATARLANDFIKKAGTRRFLRGYLEGETVYINGKNQASGAISAMAECNCMIEISPDMPGAIKGEAVKIYRIQ